MKEGGGEAVICNADGPLAMERRLPERNGPVKMRTVESDPVTVEQDCQWRKGRKSEDGPIMIKREKPPI